MHSNFSLLYNNFFKYILLIMLLQLSHFPSFILLCPAYPLLPAFPPFSSCPWVVHINSLASTFPILFLTSPGLFSIYHLCYLFSVPFHPLSPSPSPTEQPPYDLHFCDSVLFQLFAQFVLGWVLNSCEFVVILLFIFFTFFLSKSL